MEVRWIENKVHWIVVHDQLPQKITDLTTVYPAMTRAILRRFRCKIYGSDRMHRTIWSQYQIQSKFVRRYRSWAPIYFLSFFYYCYSGRAPIAINDASSPHAHNSVPNGDIVLNRSSLHDHSRNLLAMNGKSVHNSPGRPGYPGEMHNRNSGKFFILFFFWHPPISCSSIGIEHRHSNPPPGLNIQQRPTHLGLDATPPRKQSSVETKTDYGKYRYFFHTFRLAHLNWRQTICRF